MRKKIRPYFISHTMCFYASSLRETNISCTRSGQKTTYKRSFFVANVSGLLTLSQTSSRSRYVPTTNVYLSCLFSLLGLIHTIHHHKWKKGIDVVFLSFTKALEHKRGSSIFLWSRTIHKKIPPVLFQLSSSIPQAALRKRYWNLNSA